MTETEKAALNALLTSAKVLQENAMGCAANHHAHDFEEQGLPGWLHDTADTIANAQKVIDNLGNRRAGNDDRSSENALELIAELADALEEMVWLAQAQSHTHPIIFERAQQALAKARGE